MAYSKFRNKKTTKKLAKKRVSILFDQAVHVYRSSHALANRYVHLARKIAMKARMSIPSKHKRSYCKHCYIFLVPGRNARVRLHKKRRILYCTNCKKFTRIPYKK